MLDLDWILFDHIQLILQNLRRERELPEKENKEQNEKNNPEKVFYSWTLIYIDRNFLEKQTKLLFYYLNEHKKLNKIASKRYN